MRLGAGLPVRGCGRLVLCCGLVLASVAARAQGTDAAAQPSVPAMASGAHPVFAVATVKPHDPTSSRQGFSNYGERVVIRNQTLASMLSFAYAIHKGQIAGAPDWVFHEAYDIEGKADVPGEPNLLQQQEMLQSLLGERFGLRFHRERRELPVYAIRVTKGGPKLKPAAHPEAQPDQEGNGRGTEMTVTYTSSNMEHFILGEQFFLDRPIVDETGLTGFYDFSLRYTADEARVTDPNAPPGFFTAVQEQLGLKFEPTRAQTDVLVIDAVARPGEN